MEFLAAMERTALILVLALTLPLAFYGLPYASALVAQTTYVVNGGSAPIAPGGSAAFEVQCSSPSDSTSHFVNDFPKFFNLELSRLLNSAGNLASMGENPNGWFFQVHNTSTGMLNAQVTIICQTPISLAGISVPEFGSLYAAIALSAVVYFFLARRNTATKPVSIRPN